jgi:hypothetical protein
LTIHCTTKPSWSRDAGRICLGKKKINFSQVFAGQAVGIKEVHDPTRKTVKIVSESDSFELPQNVFDPIIDRVMAKLRTDRS